MEKIDLIHWSIRIFYRQSMLALLVLAPGLRAEEPVDFNDHIRPLLSDRCFTCHGFDANAREADLRLDTPEGAFGKRKDADPAIIPGDPSASILWQRIIATDDEDVMPPPDSLLRLSKSEKELIRRWIKEGAKYEPHWTFLPVKAPEIDATGGHPVDTLVSRRLKKEQLVLAPEANKRSLIRRLSLDLRGIPPQPAEVAAFLQDSSHTAWEKLVDRFLSDPAFGERMAWPWMEAARYADTNGFQGDNERTMWPWRDWVVEAFNKNLPYDDFTVWQIAGDLLPDATFEQKLATGFLRNHAINGEGGSIPEENRVNYVMDMAETVGTTWMALTYNCCRCHDHKYDPLTQKEYYGLNAFFNQTPVDGGGGNPQTPPVLAVPASDQQKAQVEALQKEQAELKVKLTDPALLARSKEVDKQLAEHRKRMPKVMIMEDLKKLRTTHVLAIGSYEQPGEEVPAHTPSFLPPLNTTGHANRLDLARWLVSRDHPLTSRVTVNRLWQEIFGIGLVKSPEDFGVQSELPIHPDLLDWLAADFMDHGWDYKRLVRNIVTSRTYRQSSQVSAALLERDPANRLLARGPRFRMASWMIRDQALAVSGLLIPKLGGEPVKPWQPPGLWAEVTFGGGKKHYVPDTGEKLRRRSLYTFWRRISAPPMFFDSAKREVCEVGTTRTNSPLHALSTLNDPLYAEASRVLTARAIRESSADPAAALARAFELVHTRPPSKQELAILLANFEAAKEIFAETPTDAEAFLSIGESPRHPDVDAVTHAAFTSVCLSMFNTDESLTKE